MSEEENKKSDHLTTDSIGGKVLITEVSTSQSETRQKSQYEPNTYFTSIKLDFVGGIDMTKIEDLKKLVLAMQTANALAASNNRKCQIRDGINPTIGTSAMASVNQTGANDLVKAELIVTPDKLKNYIQNNLNQLTKVLQQIGVNSQIESKVTPVVMDETTQQTTKVATAMPVAEPFETKPQVPKQRVNPKRTSTPVSEEQVAV